MIGGGDSVNGPETGKAPASLTISSIDCGAATISEVSAGSRLNDVAENPRRTPSKKKREAREDPSLVSHDPGGF